jgi:hypothetical protein
MAGFPAAWQWGLLCTCRISCAASARSDKAEFTQWALDRHSLHRVRRSAPGRERHSTTGAECGLSLRFASRVAMRDYRLSPQGNRRLIGGKLWGCTISDHQNNAQLRQNNPQDNTL